MISNDCRCPGCGNCGAEIIERGKTPSEAADIAGRVAYWDMRESEAKGTDR